MRNIKLKDCFYTFWLIVISIYVGMIYNRQTKGLEKLDYSVTNQDTLKGNQKVMIQNQDTIKVTKIDSAIIRINKNLNIE